MKAGQMRHVITVQRAASALDEFGGVVETWADLASLRAALGPIEQVEKQGADGAQDLARVVFQTHYFDGVTLADRVFWRGQHYAIKAIEGQIRGLRDGLKITCEGRL